MKITNLPLIALIGVLAAGCGIPMQRSSIIPTDVAVEADALALKLKGLELGISKEEAKRILGVKTSTPGIKDLIKPDDKQKALYGNASIIGSPKDMEEFRQLLDARDIVEITFKDAVKRIKSINGYSATLTTSGPEFTAYLIFLNNELVRIVVPDNYEKNETKKHYVSDILSDVAVSAAKKGGR